MRGGLKRRPDWIVKTNINIQSAGSFYQKVAPLTGILLSNLQGGGGHLRFWTFSKTNFGPFFNKRYKIVDLSLWCVIQRSRNFTKH